MTGVARPALRLLILATFVVVVLLLIFFYILNVMADINIQLRHMERRYLHLRQTAGDDQSSAVECKIQEWRETLTLTKDECGEAGKRCCAM